MSTKAQSNIIKQHSIEAKAMEGIPTLHASNIYGIPKLVGAKRVKFCTMSTSLTEQTLVMTPTGFLAGFSGSHDDEIISKEATNGMT